MTETTKPKAGWLNLVVDYGPVIVFFAVYKYYSPADRENSIAEVLAVIKGTVSFMVAAVIALLVSKWKLGKISPMLWLSTVLIVGFGGLTVLLHDPIWIRSSRLRSISCSVSCCCLGFGAARRCSRSCWRRLSRAWTTMAG